MSVLVPERKIVVGSQLELEAAVVELSASLLPPDQGAIVREQYARAEIVDREFSGTGFFTEFAVDSTAPKLSVEIKRIDSTGPLEDNVGITIMASGSPFAEPGAGFVLHMHDGYLGVLEGFTFGPGSWPSDPDLTGTIVRFASLGFFGEPRDTSPVSGEHR